MTVYSYDQLIVGVRLAGPLDAMLRSLVIGRLGRCGDEKTVKEAQRRFTAHCSGDETLAADLRASVSVGQPIVRTRRWRPTYGRL